MAADLEEPQAKRKLETLENNRKKLLPNEKVEVRSLEYGFLGSWHTATILHCEKLCRVIRYDHLLSDDGSAILSDRVEVTPEIDGVVPSGCGTSDSHRGVIRPLPLTDDPRRSWSLHYGECVDFLYEDAWWEGVIIDHEDGCVKRRVFFPDMGDEMETPIDRLRVTQDWDEITGEWKHRGIWLFLKVIEQFKHDWPLPVSIKQIWYEVRLKNDFEKLKEWTCASWIMWRKLVLQVLSDNYEITIEHFFNELKFSGDFNKPVQSLPEFSEPAHDSVPENGLVPSSVAVLPYEAACLEIISNDIDNDIPTNQHALSVVVLNQDPGICSISSHKEVPGTNLELSHRKSTKKTRLHWIPAVPHLVPGAEFCPDAIIKLKEMYKLKKRPTVEMIKNARKHLLHLEWKVEYVVNNFANKVRYVSPEGELFYSLHQACMRLEQVDYKSGPEPLMLSMSMNDSVENLPAGIIYSPLIEKSEPFGELSSMPSPSDAVVIEAKCCPEAVKEYYFLGLEYAESGRGLLKNTRSKSMKAKKHLSFVGWSFYYILKGGKRTMTYRSPDGKLFDSLFLACKWCVENGGTENADAVEDSCSSLFLKGSRLPVLALDVQGNSPLVNDDRLPNVSSMTKDVVQSMKKARALQKRRPYSKHCHRNPNPCALTNVKVDKDPEYSTPVLRPSKRTQETVASTPQISRTVLSWLIDNHMVLPNAKIQYRRGKNGPPTAEGRIAREGIKCICCGKVYTLSKFEAHAGGKNHRPLTNIFLEDGRSLLECQLQLKKHRSNKCPRLKAQISGSTCDKTNDDVCSVCLRDGELVLCDECPSSFHTHCLGLKEVPDGDWFCPSCRCGICGLSGFDRRGEKLTNSSVLICGQCEHKYHVGCLGEKGIFDLNSRPEGFWFCQDSCEQIFQGLCKILGKAMPLGTENLTWTIIKYSNKDSGDHDVSGNEYMVENYSKLTAAFSVIHECFEPVEVPETGRDLVEDIIFCRQSELNRLNFRGFYTVLLEKNDELISAATVRIHGRKVAEIPLVATREEYRRRGMCRILLNALEEKLMELGVERLVLPSISDMLTTWTSAFGFSVMNESERLSFLDYTFLDFPGTFLCYKLLTNIPSTVSSLSTVTLEKDCDLVNKHSNTELDQNSSISGVSRADRNDETDIADQGPTCIANNTGNGYVQLPDMVDQPSPENCSAIPNRASHEFPVWATNAKPVEDKNTDGRLKSCKRRKISTC